MHPKLALFSAVIAALLFCASYYVISQNVYEAVGEQECQDKVTRQNGMFLSSGSECTTGWQFGKCLKGTVDGDYCMTDGGTTVQVLGILGIVAGVVAIVSLFKS